MRDTIIFDHGGVLEKHNISGFCKWLEKKFNLDQEIKPIFRRLEHQRDVGKINSSQFVKMLCCELNINISAKEAYGQYYKNYVTQSQDVIKFIRNKLVGKYNLFIFSNNSRINIQMFGKKVKQKEIFSKRVYSFTIGVRKPDKKFFKRGLKIVNKKGTECYFIDDQLKSKENSEEQGLKFIQFKNLPQLKKDLKKLKII